MWKESSLKEEARWCRKPALALPFVTLWLWQVTECESSHILSQGCYDYYMGKLGNNFCLTVGSVCKCWLCVFQFLERFTVFTSSFVRELGAFEIEICKIVFSSGGVHSERER